MGRGRKKAKATKIGTPEHTATINALGIDAYVAGTVMSSDAEGRQSERAARIAGEHRIWVAVASFAGNAGDGFENAAGRSGIWAPGGSAVFQTGPARLPPERLRRLK